MRRRKVDLASARGLILPIAAVMIAEAAFRLSGVNSDTLAPPSAILVAGAEGLRDGSLLQATGQTLWAIAIGFLAGGLIGLALGVLFGMSLASARLSALTVELLRPVPSVALLPIALLEFGFGVKLEATLIAFSCIWPMMVIAQSAVQAVDGRLIEVARVLELPIGRRLTKIVLPAILPRLFVGVRLALGVALVVAVTVEVTANPYGLGYALMTAQQSLRPALALAFLVWIGIIGWGLNRGLMWVQQHAFNDATGATA